MKTGVQQIMLGTITGSYSQALSTLKQIKSLGYDGIELNGFMIRPTSFFVRALTKLAGMPTGNGGKLDWNALIKESGLEVISVHEDLGTIERDIQSVISEVKSFGTDKVVVTGMYRFDYTDEGKVRELANRLNAAGKIFRENGIRFCYHNHNVELLRIGEKCAYDVLIEETNPDNVFFEFDSYWFTEAGADAKMYMERLGQRMILWHATDRGSRMKGTAMTPIISSDCVELGTGNMNLEGMRNVAKQNGVEAIVLESHKNWIDNDPMKSIKLSSKFFAK